MKKGRPTTEEGIKAVTENLEVQRKHGAFEFFRTNVVPVPSCSQCIFASDCEYFEKGQKQCLAIKELQEEVYEELVALKYMKLEDRFLIDRFVKNFCFLIIIERWIAHVGPFQANADGLDVQPILKIKTHYERLALKQADASGIGPQARARLNLTNVQSFCFAEALQRTKPINNQTAEIIIQDEEHQAHNEGEVN